MTLYYCLSDRNKKLPFKIEMSLRNQKKKEPLKTFYEALYFILHRILYSHLEWKNVLKKPKQNKYFLSDKLTSFYTFKDFRFLRKKIFTFLKTSAFTSILHL